MDIRVVSKESRIAERRAARRAAGTPRQRPNWTQLDEFKRLITTSDGLQQVANTIILDVNDGREDNPTVYEDIYRTISDANLPQNVPTNLLGNANAVFLQRPEGAETKFGHVSQGATSTVPIVGYSAGFEYTDEMVEFNQTWAIQDFNRSLGEADNALNNHIHLSPFIGFTYAGGNTTNADSSGATVLDRTRNTFVAAQRTASMAKRPGSVLLASSANKYQIQDGLARRFDNVGNALPALDDISTIIYYDGYSITIGPKTYTYPGVPSGECYLIRPKRQFVELVKRAMFIVTGNPDVSRRIAEQIVAHQYRGAYAAIAANTQKILLP